MHHKVCDHKRVIMEQTPSHCQESGGYSSLWQSVQCCVQMVHLVGKRQLLVYSGASYSNGDSIWESHHKSSAQGKHSPNGTVDVILLLMVVQQRPR